MKSVTLLFITIFISGCGGETNLFPPSPPTPVSYTITVKAGMGGTISSKAALDGVNGRVNFDVRSDKGYTIDNISGCGGQLSGPFVFGAYFYKTEVLAADCTINVSFRRVIVSSNAGLGGDISFSTPVINDEARAQFQIIFDEEFMLNEVSGCGSFLLADDLYSTEVLYGDCTVNVTFKSMDPLYADQWHLKNTGQAGNDKKTGKVGEDINVEPVWNSCIGSACRGEGVRIVVVDDGLDIRHEDLKENVVLGKSFDYIGNDTDPSPSFFPLSRDGGHGTSVAGIIAARDLNGVGVRGVAPRAELVAYNFLMAATSVNESDAMTRDAAQNHISNNSWGAEDGKGRLVDSSAVWRAAVNTGHRIGRDGLGTIYVWAAGNGHVASFGGMDFLADNSNYDGYANYRGVVAVGSVTNLGQRTFYSEQGANLLVSAPGGEVCSKHTIVTTDITGAGGYNSGQSKNDYSDSSYTACFGSTSAAAPMVSGVAALILQANPRLGWRDVHAILARSARKNDPLDVDWQINGAGLSINHNYGFGVVDAEAAVLLAKSWANLEAEKKFSTSKESINIKIGDNDGTSVHSTLSVTSSGISNIEFVEIIFSADDHPHSGDLEIILLNKATGTTSRLAENHICEANSCTSYANWRFGSTRHLGEGADGDWQLIVRDKEAEDKGTFQAWQLNFYGT